MPHLDQARYAQGQAAYTQGLGIGHLIEIGDEVEKAASKAYDEAKSPEERDAAHRMGRGDAVPSLIAGFMDGLINDVRSIVGRSRVSGRA